MAAMEKPLTFIEIKKKFVGEDSCNAVSPSKVGSKLLLSSVRC